MNLLAPITDIMTSKIITLGPEDNLKKLVDIFSENKIHHVPVIDKGDLVGLISKSDFSSYKRAKEQNPDYLSLKVKDIMITKLAKLESTDRINVAIEVFKENRLHALPVVEDNQLLGIVTTHDIISHLANDNEIVKVYNN